MDEEPKNFVAVAPWPDYNDTGTTPHFKDGVSEPVTEKEATRLAQALGGTSRPLATSGPVKKPKMAEGGLVKPKKGKE